MRESTQAAVLHREVDSAPLTCCTSCSALLFESYWTRLVLCVSSSELQQLRFMRSCWRVAVLSAVDFNVHAGFISWHLPISNCIGHFSKVKLSILVLIIIQLQDERFHLLSLTCTVLVGAPSQLPVPLSHMRRVMLSSQRSSTVAFVSISKGYLLRLGRGGIAQTGTVHEPDRCTWQS
jgi:hypothetical protein